METVPTPVQDEMWLNPKNGILYKGENGCWVPLAFEPMETPPLVNAFRAFAWSALIIAAGGIGFWVLNTTLHDMTVRDCNLGVQAACEELKR